MKKIFFVIFLGCFSLFAFSQQIKYAAKDSILIEVKTTIDSNFISLSEIEYQLKALDQRIDELTSEINRLNLRRNDYLLLKKKYFELLK